MSKNTKRSTTKTTSSQTRTTLRQKSTVTRFNWDMLSNSKVRNAYSRFASGKSSAREIENELKNTDYISAFRKLVRERGTERARDAARLAISRRTV